jgi:hypothetical protein
VINPRSFSNHSGNIRGAVIQISQDL